METEKQSNKSARYRKLFDEHRKIVLTSYEQYTMSDCLRVFKNIYAGRIHIHTLEGIGFHFLEEVGEAAVAIRKLGQLRYIASHPDTGVDANFLKGLTSVEGIVNKYEGYMGNGEKKILIDSRDPEMLKLRIVDAKMELVSEIADSFSWFCAIQNKLAAISETILENPATSYFPTIEGKLEKEYIGKDGKPNCATCKKEVCACAFYHEEYAKKT